MPNMYDVWSPKPYPQWVLGPETLNIGDLDPLTLLVEPHIRGICKMQWSRPDGPGVLWRAHGGPFGNPGSSTGLRLRKLN